MYQGQNNEGVSIGATTGLGHVRVVTNICTSQTFHSINSRGVLLLRVLLLKVAV